MSLNQHQQLYEILGQSNNPLIAFKKEPSGDTIAGSLALSQLLKKLGQKPEIISPGFHLPESYRFLPNAHEIGSEFNNLRKLTISLPLHEGNAPKFEQRIENDKFHLDISPGNSHFTKDDLIITDSNYRHDLIITLNTPDLESLEHLYSDNTDFFYNVPIVNLDFSPENEHYGHLNIINITATSISEILYDIIQQIDTNLLDENIATCLLTGMIERTKSFRIPTITPRSLNVASELMAAGAERSSIIKNLYQTKTVNALRLWGRILLNLNTDIYQKIAWAEVTEKDFSDTSTTESDLTGVIEELITNIPTIELSALFYRKGDNLFAIVKSEKGHDLKTVFKDLNPDGIRQLIKFNTPDTAQSILERLKALL